MVLVFDVGGTNIRFALVQSSNYDEVVRIRTERSNAGFGQFLAALKEKVGGQKLEAVVGGFPGQLNDEGEVVYTGNLPDWVGTELVKGLHEVFECPVHVRNDVELCGLGEAHFGAGIIEGVMTYYTVSTGVNAVRIVDGKIDETIGRFELGSQIVGQEEGRGESLESLIGGAALEKRLGVAPHEVRGGSVWRGLERHLALGLYNTVLFWNPQVIVLGGKMMIDIKLDMVWQALTGMTMTVEEWPELKGARLGDEAGIKGAIVLLGQLGYK